MRRLRLFAGGRPVSFASGKAEGDDETVPSSAAKGKATLVVKTPKTADVIPGVQAEAPHEDQPSQSSMAMPQGEASRHKSSPTSVMQEPLTREDIKTDGLLLEPWKMVDMCDLSLEDRVRLAKTQCERIDGSSAPFGTVPMSRGAELEIFFTWFIWMLSAMLTPVVFLALPFLPLVLEPAQAAAAVLVAASLAVLCLYPHQPIGVPARTRAANPLHNRALALSFMKYFPMRCILEDDSVLELQKTTGLILGGLPHGLFPIGMLVLSICGFALPFKRLRGATASAILRLPIWRQVLRWNSGIDVSRESITSALASQDNVVVAMDGIAGMFACCPPNSFKDGREAYLIRRRKGLCRIALETGSPLVPFVMFGNTKCVAPVADPFGVMEFLSRRLGVSLIWSSGRCGLPVPHRTPVTIVIGRPLSAPPGEGGGGAGGGGAARPTEEQVSAMHEELVSEMSRMYSRWQRVAGYEGVDLVVT
jgi:hypothetical protein